MVTKGSVQIKGKRCSYPNFEFIFSARVRDDFPKVLTRGKACAANNSSKNVSGLFEYNKSTVIFEL